MERHSKSAHIIHILTFPIQSFDLEKKLPPPNTNEEETAKQCLRSKHPVFAPFIAVYMASVLYLYFNCYILLHAATICVVYILLIFTKLTRLNYSIMQNFFVVVCVCVSGGQHDKTHQESTCELKLSELKIQRRVQTRICSAHSKQLQSLKNGT